ncbi:YfhO family protein [Dysgonomonas sp. 520]|uniref:YfhO family protein n=1 Tax=Dysgonomonas sp. 520 TaxID=2302931 RepID=UPI0013D75E89|nr:YfhO family protein [Dysgonomonas sp. 520]NDW09983.1 hypothetical protein [Dysgonomonas sp. 520]
MNKLEENKKSVLTKKIFYHLIAITCLLVITMVYFSPTFQGKSLFQSDVTQFMAASHELEDYYEKDGESSAWTGSMFSGMPAYHIGIWGTSPNFISYLEAPLRLMDGGSAAPIFGAMLMAYIMFCIMGFSPLVALLGAIGYGFTSYNIIITEAGHITKLWTLVYLPLVIAGIIELFRKKYIMGGLLFAIGLALQIRNNHIQITYYTGLLCFFLYAWQIVNEIIAKRYKDLLKLAGVTIIAIVVAICCNLGSLYSNYAMSEESTRGQTELSTPTESEKTSTGLDIEYAFRWSYGKGETMTLLIPNAYGGISMPFDRKSETFKEVMSLFQNQKIDESRANFMLSRGTQYWGDQPFTSGPVYFGAVVCFLFIIGMIVIKNKIKWLILGATIFFIILSWGNNFMAFNSWFFYNIPMYNKFRTVSMALVIPSITMLFIAVWALNDIVTGKIDKKILTKAIYWTTGVLGAICFLAWLVPDAFFSFESINDLRMKDAIGIQDADWEAFQSALASDRMSLLSADALRSLIFIVLTGAILWIGLKVKQNEKTALIFPAILTVLVLVDLWNVDRRYLDDSKFKQRKGQTAKLFPQSEADKMILEDKHPSYRVLNLSAGAQGSPDPFNEANTSYYHKSIGGYSAAKLRRYQELIDFYLGKEVQLTYGYINHYNQELSKQFMEANPPQDIKTQEEMNAYQYNMQLHIGKFIQDTVVAKHFGSIPVLNMLNAKYIIHHPMLPPLVNIHAFGNAWFVNDLRFVENADAEIATLGQIDPRRTAVVDKRYEAALGGFKPSLNNDGNIELISYKPNELVYKSKTNSEQLAVFSEIFFANGWQAFVDGKEVPHFCADWTLRAMKVPAGEHEIVFKFIPKEFNTANAITTVISAILVLSLLVFIGLNFWRMKQQK